MAIMSVRLMYTRGPPNPCWVPLQALSAVPDLRLITQGRALLLPAQHLRTIIQGPVLLRVAHLPARLQAPQAVHPQAPLPGLPLA